VGRRLIRLIRRFDSVGHRDALTAIELVDLLAATTARFPKYGTINTARLAVLGG
jgi:hypothetical protein